MFPSWSMRNMYPALWALVLKFFSANKSLRSLGMCFISLFSTLKHTTDTLLLVLIFLQKSFVLMVTNVDFLAVFARSCGILSSLMTVSGQ